MLYLTRKEGESVMIGDHVKVTVDQTWRQRAAITVQRDFGLSTVVAINSTLVPGKPLNMDGFAIVLRATSRGQCKLGFKAPRNVPIHRLEVYNRIAEANDDDS